MPIIVKTTANYEEYLKAIRFRVNNAYDEDDLPDSTIENYACLGEANAKIAMKVPGWASLDTQALERLRSAVVYQAAIEALLSESRILAEDVEASEVARYESMKIKDTIEFYQARVDSIIPEVITPTGGLIVGVFEAYNPTKRF